METDLTKKRRMAVEESLTEEQELDGSGKLNSKVPGNEIPSLKKKREGIEKQLTGKQECSENQGQLEGTGELEANVPGAEMPSLVFSIFVETTTDIELLKVCRLVCKAWNEEVCGVFRIHTAVTYSTELQWMAKDFASLLACREFGDLADLPMPFRNFKVESDFWEDGIYEPNEYFQPYPLDAFIWEPQVIVTDITLVACSNFTRNLGCFEDSSFKKLLLANSKSLEMVEILLEPESYPAGTTRSLMVPLHCHICSDDVLNINVIYEPNEVFEPNCFDNFPYWPELVETLLKMREWKCLFVNVIAINTESLMDFFIPDILLSLSVLKLDLTTVIPKKLGSLLMPRLHALQVTHNRKNIKQVAALVRNVAGTVKVLEVSYIKMGLFPTLPELESLAVRKMKMSVDQFPRKQFPVLAQVTKQSSFFNSHLH